MASAASPALGSHLVGGGKLLIPVHGRSLGRRVLAVQPHLEEDRVVQAALHHTADPELHGSLAHKVVARLEHVTDGPHDHHVDAHAECRLVLDVACELRCPEHRLDEHGQEAHGLHEPVLAQHKVGHASTHRPHDQHKV